MARLFTNNAASTLAFSIVPATTSVVIQASDASEFPAAGSGNTFQVTVQEGTTVEIMTCTNRTGATLTVTRGQEGTAAGTFSTNAVVEHRLTAGDLTHFETDATLITTKGDIVQGGTGGVPERLAIGTTGQVPTVTGGKLAYATPSVDIPASLLDAKGDIVTATAADTPARKAVGATGSILYADSAQATGLAWLPPANNNAAVLFQLSGVPTWREPGGAGQVLGLTTGPVLQWVDHQRTLNIQNGSVATGADTNETDAFSYTLPAAALVNNTNGVRILVWGTTAANANSKRYRVYFGSTMIYDSTASTQNNSPWYAECVVWRTGAATQDAIGYGCFHLNGVGTRNLFTQPTETLSGTVVIKVTITNSTANAGDITGKGMMVSFVPTV